MAYLTDIPQNIGEYGFAKTLLVRREVIHWKHIMTEVFVRKTIDIQPILGELNMTLFDYMEYMTHRLRHIHHFSREYRFDMDSIVKTKRESFFKQIELFKGLNNLIILDFDGVVTEKSFEDLYKLCLEREKTVICSANPTIKETYFLEKRNIPLPVKINSCKGKIQKLNVILDLHKRYDNVFYIDNEEKYLKVAWLFGIQTFIYQNKKIVFYSLKTK